MLKIVFSKLAVLVRFNMYFYEIISFINIDLVYFLYSALYFAWLIFIGELKIRGSTYYIYSPSKIGGGKKTDIHRTDIIPDSKLYVVLIQWSRL